MKTQFVRGIKLSGLLALVHYTCVWASLLAWFVLFGHMDEPRSTARQQCALISSTIHDTLLQPLGDPRHGESNFTAHLRILLNSLLWGTAAGTLLLVGSRLASRERNPP
jgi:hypothetical protein